MKTIYITGSLGEIGLFIFNYLKSHKYRVIRVIRSPLNKEGLADNLVFNYTLKNPNVTYLISSRCVVIHCGFNFNEKKLYDNSNFQYIHNLHKFFPNAYFINISTMSAFSMCKSNYGKIKFEIERLVLKKSGINLRLGIPIANPPISFHKLVLRISNIFPFFNFGINAERKCFIYTTNMIKFCRVIEDFIKNGKKKSGTFSVVSPRPLTMNSFIMKYTGKPVLSIHWTVLYACLSILNLLKIKLRFGNDSLIGLVNSIDLPENNISV